MTGVSGKKPQVIAANTTKTMIASGHSLPFL
jgi:hypothetical protein